MRHCQRNLHNYSFETSLTDVGHIQAIESCNIMFKYNITQIYSSPFLRTIQTSNYYSKKYNIPINIDYSLAEFVDQHEKHLMTSINNYKIPSIWYKQYNINKNIDNMIYNIFNINETINDSVNRVILFIKFIKKKYINTNHNILLVTHMSIINILLAYQENTLSNININIDKFYPMGLITEINI